MTPSLQGTTPGMPLGNLRSPWRWGFLAVTLAPVLVVTLVPAGDQSVLTRFALCLICGDFGTANLVRNVVLFVPLGAAFALLLGPGRWALLAVFAVTATIESLQFHIPGRNPMVADLVANFAGGALSVGAVRWSYWWMAPPQARGAALSLVAAAVASGVLLGTAWLFTVELPRTTYWGQWTPNLGHLDRYHGQVLSASLGELELPSGRLEDPSRVRSALIAGDPIRVAVEAGPPPAGVAPIFSIYDRDRQEILLLGAHGDDLVGRIRLRAHRLRFDRPDLRLAGGLRDMAVGDTVNLEFKPAWEGGCLAIDGQSECGIGPNVERGWALLRYLGGPPERVRRLLDFGWMFGLVFPFGFFARRHLLTWAGTGLLLSVAGAGSAFALTSLLGLLGAGAGAVVGILVGSRLRSC